ncbi:MAG: hypothetical protein ACREFC_13885 [Stellaceae bacterium]
MNPWEIIAALSAVAAVAVGIAGLVAAKHTALGRKIDDIVRDFVRRDDYAADQARQDGEINKLRGRVHRHANLLTALLGPRRGPGDEE